MGSSIPKYMLGVVLGMAAGLFMGAVLRAKAAPRQAEVPKVLRAQSFELVGSEGQVRARLSFDEAKDPYLKIFDNQDREVVSLGYEHRRAKRLGDHVASLKFGGPRLSLRSKYGGEVFVQVGENAEDNTWISISGPGGNRLITPQETYQNK